MSDLVNGNIIEGSMRHSTDNKSTGSVEIARFQGITVSINKNQLPRVSVHIDACRVLQTSRDDSFRISAGQRGTYNLYVGANVTPEHVSE